MSAALRNQSVLPREPALRPYCDFSSCLTSTCSLSPLSYELSRKLIPRDRRIPFPHELQNPGDFRRIGPPRPRREILLRPQPRNSFRHDSFHDISSIS
jgi:hypothetical protein